MVNPRVSSSAKKTTSSNSARRSSSSSNRSSSSSNRSSSSNNNSSSGSTGSSASSSSSVNNNTNSTTTQTDPNESINKEACEKYGITINEIPTEPVEPYSRYNDDDTIYGFITEVTHDQKGTEIEIKDWGYCLEDNTIELGFQNMHRSEIFEEVIKSYGLVPVVDLSDLKDEVISWDNSTSKGSSSSGDTGSGDSSGCASLDEAVDKAIQGKSDPLEKAKAIDQAFKSYIIYEYYYDCQYPNDLDAAWQDANLNCADGANILSAMFTRGGFSPCIVYVPGHYIVRVPVNGKNWFTDNAANTGQHTSRPFGQVWRGITSGTDKGTHLSY